LKKAYVFQNYKDTLLPWFNNFKNVSIINNDPTKIHELLKAFGLNDLQNKYPYELSGGQQQMLSLAKAFAYSADIMLLDEPFSGLDYNKSRYFWNLFTNFWNRQNTTTFLVSHSIEEALYLGEKIHIFSNDTKNKFLEQIDLPFPKPNGLDWFKTDNFFQTRKRIEDLITNQK
jgi:NitT/TauT family transport system ATP-binding protein